MKKKPLEGTPVIKLYYKPLGCLCKSKGFAFLRRSLGVYSFFQAAHRSPLQSFALQRKAQRFACLSSMPNEAKRCKNEVFACKAQRGSNFAFSPQLCYASKASLLQVTQVVSANPLRFTLQSFALQRKSQRQALRCAENSSLQLKKIVSGEISKTPFLDILLTDLEQSSFSLIRRNEIESKKCSKLASPPIFLLSRKNSVFLHRKAYLQRTRSIRANEKVFKIFIKSSAFIEDKKKYKVATKKVCNQEAKLLQSATSTFAAQSINTLLQKSSDAKTNLLQFCNTSFVQSLCKKTSFLRDASFLKMEDRFNSIHKDCYKEPSFCTALCQVKTGDYVHCGDKIGNISGTPIVISESGKILKINPWQVTIQKMQPVLFYSQAEIHVESDEWVKRGTPILTLAHQTLVTGDIVQGIPRIEQLFEASTSTPPGTALQDFGSYFENDSSTKSLEEIYDYLHDEGSKNDFTKLQPQLTNFTQACFANPLQAEHNSPKGNNEVFAMPLQSEANRRAQDDAKLSPSARTAKTKFLQATHSIRDEGMQIQRIRKDTLRACKGNSRDSPSLEKVTKNTIQARQTKSAYTFTVNSNVEEKPLLLYKTLQSQVRELFRKKWNILPLPVAVRQSLEEIQQIIVESIQKVYLSQGVLIADKHIEIIVRQMTSKAQIFDGGNTGLLIDEILSLQQIENANISTPGQKALYLPVILGLTRAALSSDSFVSAASFQETTRVLSRDAVAGKSDFLRGLKEKVIIGDLIDAGTGLDVFYVYSLFSKKIFENKFFPNDDLKVTHKMLRKLVKRATK